MMELYHKINAPFKRDMDGDRRLQLDQFCDPAFEYLARNEWTWTEKIDGTNIRIGWDGLSVSFGGRTDKAQMPPFLDARLREVFTPEKLTSVWDTEPDITLHGEGYGRKIQKAGASYIPDGVDFILFDVRVGNWLLQRDKVDAIAEHLGIKSVPVVMHGDIWDAIETVKSKPKSLIGTDTMEGLVGVPLVDLRLRSGQRVITKIKVKDFT